MQDFIKLFQESMDNYAENLKKWYPAQEDNDPKERNLTFYFGNMLLENKYTVFQEVPNSTGKMRIDLVATKGNVCVLVEAKRFYDLDEVKLINKDIKRIKTINLSCIPNYKNMVKVGVILAQTYVLSRESFWNKLELPNVRNREWTKLKNNLPFDNNLRITQKIYSSLTVKKLWSLLAVYHI